MTDQSARQPYSWEQWNRDVNAKIVRLQKQVALLQNSYYGSIEDHKAGKPPAIIRLILNTAIDMASERKFMCDAGIWSVEQLYAPGATVTKDGCAWVCQVENQGVKPGTSSAWRLLQKSIDVEIRREIRSLVRDELRKKS